MGQLASFFLFWELKVHKNCLLFLVLFWTTRFLFWITEFSILLSYSRPESVYVFYSSWFSLEIWIFYNWVKLWYKVSKSQPQESKIISKNLNKVGEKMKIYEKRKSENLSLNKNPFKYLGRLSDVWVPRVALV